jgi:hypothetical protein
MMTLPKPTGSPRRVRRQASGYWRIIGCNYQTTVKVDDGR